MELDEEIEQKEQELNALKSVRAKERLESIIKQKDDYTDDEKIEWFNRMWDRAYNELVEMIEEVLGHSIWDAVNHPEKYR
jgi:hypothetical protein